jgi:hypothetical protein
MLLLKKLKNQLFAVSWCRPAPAAMRPRLSWRTYTSYNTSQFPASMRTVESIWRQYSDKLLALVFPSDCQIIILPFQERFSGLFCITKARAHFIKLLLANHEVLCIALNHLIFHRQDCYHLKRRTPPLHGDIQRGTQRGSRREHASTCSVPATCISRPSRTCCSWQDTH